LLLGEAPIDWIDRLNPQTTPSNFNFRSALNDSVAEEHLFLSASPFSELKNEQPTTVSPLPLSAYVGSFNDAAYGKLKVSEQSGKLIVSYNDWKATLTPIGGHVFRCAGGFSGNASFAIDSQSRVKSVSFLFEPTVSPIRFAR
jgi:hypothetical protein